jgi:tetratricopeptide (TPR) repeat protein
MTAADLLERGIRAYTRGALAEAERCWNEALALDPGNDRARSYLDVLLASGSAAPAPPAAATRGAGQGRAVPLPAPASAPATAEPVPLPLPAPKAAAPAPGSPAPAGKGAGQKGPVPLPAPAPPAAPWMRSPITLPPQQPTPTPSPGEEPPPPVLTPVAAEPAPARDDHISVNDYVASPWDDGPASVPAVVLDDGDGLDLASVDEQSGLRPLVPDSPLPAVRPHARPRSDVEVWMDGARELFALGDFSGSLEMIEKILRIDPHHTEARLYLEQNESTLTAMYESKLGPGDATPRLAIGGEEVMWLNLDHRAGFLLAQIDGTVTYDDLFAVSGLPRLDTARILATLLQEGVITS